MGADGSGQNLSRLVKIGYENLAVFSFSWLLSAFLAVVWLFGLLCELQYIKCRILQYEQMCGM